MVNITITHGLKCTHVQWKKTTRHWRSICHWIFYIARECRYLQTKQNTHNALNVSVAAARHGVPLIQLPAGPSELRRRSHLLAQAGRLLLDRSPGLEHASAGLRSLAAEWGGAAPESLGIPELSLR